MNKKKNNEKMWEHLPPVDDLRKMSEEELVAAVIQGRLDEEREKILGGKKHEKN